MHIDWVWVKTLGGGGVVADSCLCRPSRCRRRVLNKRDLQSQYTRHNAQLTSGSLERNCFRNSQEWGLLSVYFRICFVYVTTNNLPAKHQLLGLSDITRYTLGLAAGDTGGNRGQQQHRPQHYRQRWGADWASVGSGLPHYGNPEREKNTWRSLQTVMQHRCACAAAGGDCQGAAEMHALELLKLACTHYRRTLDFGAR